MLAGQSGEGTPSPGLPIAHSGIGKTEVWMSNLARQPFFQERVVSILKGKNRDALESMFKIQRFSNPMTLVELASDLKKPVVDTRGVQARDILDRAFRKKEVTSPDPGAGV